jgi:hypothetical protein
VSREPITMAEIFRWFIRRRSKTDPESGWLVLDVTPEECEEVGRDLITFIAACAGELAMKHSTESGVLMEEGPLKEFKETIN